MEYRQSSIRFSLFILNTLISLSHNFFDNHCQISLCSLIFYLSEIHKDSNEKGAWITPAFPKLIYVLEEDNIREDSEYFYLTKLCAKCSVKRLVPDYISEKMMIQNKIDTNGDGHCFPCMGCRSFLTPYLDENGKPKYYGRFNQGVVTINLPDVGLSAVKRMEGITYVNDEQYQKRKKEIFWETMTVSVCINLILNHHLLRNIIRHKTLYRALST